MFSLLTQTQNPAGWAQIASLLIVAPVLEEVIFRLGLQAWLMRRVSVFQAAWVSTLAFGVAHAGLRGSVLLGLGVLPLASLNAYVFARTQRVWPCMAIHAGANGLWLGASYFLFAN